MVAAHQESLRVLAAVQAPAFATLTTWVPTFKARTRFLRLRYNELVLQEMKLIFILLGPSGGRGGIVCLSHPHTSGMRYVLLLTFVDCKGHLNIQRLT